MKLLTLLTLSLGAAALPLAAAPAPGPLAAIEAAHPAAMSADLVGVHPRLFVTQAEIDALKVRLKTTHQDLWARALAVSTCLTREPAPAPAQGRRDQNDVAYAIAESAFFYKLTDDPRYLAAARKFMNAALSYDTWGYTFDKPNTDLGAAHLLYGLGWAYDLLYHDLTPEELTRYRATLVLHGNLMYKSLALKPGKQLHYSQNHLFIPTAGLGIAAYALYGDVPEAAQWATRARAIYDRVLATYSQDGYYFEGFEYWVFATPWIIHYLDALKHSTGEDLYDQPGLKAMHTYVAQSMLPGAQDVFDFGDVFEGPSTRARQGADAERTHPGGHLHSNFNLLYRTAQEYHSGEDQGVANWLAAKGQVNFEDLWSLLWFDPTVKAVPIEDQPTAVHFIDHDVVYWRSSWKDDATALAVKAGPPEGHSAMAAMARFPDWALEDGHVHPDIGSFILFANGQYLTGDTGYAGVPLSADHNTLLVDGKGQANDGKGHDAYLKYPYSRSDGCRITAFVHNDPTHISIGLVATTAYREDFQLTRYTRGISLEPGRLLVEDQVESAFPHVYSVLVHFDGDQPAPGFSVTVKTPLDAVIHDEADILTAPGKPGSVDKGPKEKRGSRRVISTAGPVTSAEFETILDWRSLPK